MMSAFMDWHDAIPADDPDPPLIEDSRRGWNAALELAADLVKHYPGVLHGPDLTKSILGLREPQYPGAAGY